MKYRVLSEFVDATDYPHSYKPGDIFPRAGLDPKPQRVAFLVKQKLIEPVEEKPQPKQKVQNDA